MDRGLVLSFPWSWLGLDCSPESPTTLHVRQEGAGVTPPSPDGVNKQSDRDLQTVPNSLLHRAVNDVFIPGIKK